VQLTEAFTVVRALSKKGRACEQAVETFEPYRAIQEKNEGAREGMREVAEESEDARIPVREQPAEGQCARHNRGGCGQ